MFLAHPPPRIYQLLTFLFHCRLKTFLFSVFPSIAIYPLLRLISWNLTTQSQKRYISPIWGQGPTEPIFTKIWTVVAVPDHPNMCKL